MSPLHIKHSWHLTPHRLPPRIVSDVSTPIIQAARGLLKEAENRVREQHSDVEVDCELLPEETVPGLIHRSEQAELLVVGSRGRNRLASTLLGSVSQQLVAHSPCPVIVLREHRAGHHLSASQLGTITTTAPVVLGVAPEEMAAPVEFAFAEASRRGVPLRAIRTWLYPQTYPGVITLPRLEEDQRNLEESADLAEILAPSQLGWPVRGSRSSMIRVPRLLCSRANGPAGRRSPGVAGLRGVLGGVMAVPPMAAETGPDGVAGTVGWSGTGPRAQVGGSGSETSWSTEAGAARGRSGTKQGRSAPWATGRAGSTLAGTRDPPPLQWPAEDGAADYRVVRVGAPTGVRRRGPCRPDQHRRRLPTAAYRAGTAGSVPVEDRIGLHRHFTLLFTSSVPRSPRRRRREKDGHSAAYRPQMSASALKSPITHP